LDRRNYFSVIGGLFKKSKELIGAEDREDKVFKPRPDVGQSFPHGGQVVTILFVGDGKGLLPTFSRVKTRTAQMPPPLAVLKATIAELALWSTYRLAVVNSISEKAMRWLWNQNLGP
jgi:hypothetical protein